MTSNGRVARLTALALATGTLVAAGAGSASAATTTKDVFNAYGTGRVLSIAIKLPAAIPGVTDAQGRITQDLVLTGSNASTSSFTTPAAAAASSILGANGTIPVVSPLLAKSLTATYGSPNPASQGTFPANPLISGGVLNLTSETANPDVAGQIAHSLSSVAQLRIDGVGTLQALLDAVTAQITAVLNGVVGTLPTGAPAQQVAGLTTTITDLLGNVVTQLNTATNGAAQPVKDAVDAVIKELNALPTALAQQIKLKTADTSLLSIGLIQSEQTVSRTMDVVTSTSSNKLVGISALGGLATVDGLTSEASASLGKGATAPVTKVKDGLASVHVADLLTVEVTKGLTAALGGSAVPQAVKDAVNGALATIGTTLNGVVNATIRKQPTAVPTVSTADHAHAEVAAAEFVVGVPLLQAEPILAISLVPSVADVTKIAAQQVTPPTVVTAPPAQAISLPRTGANLPLTGAAATALLGLAMVARRRRLAHLSD